MLRFVCVTLLFSSTGFILEILGDIKLDGSGRGFDEESSNYETTLFRQLYYVVVTLSTVGYGDVLPNSTLHQAFTLVMIVTGVAFFSSEVTAVIGLMSEINSGMGQYRRSRFRNYHILAGGLVHTNRNHPNPSRRTTYLQGWIFVHLTSVELLFGMTLFPGARWRGDQR